MKDDAISRQAVLKLLYSLPPEEAMTKAMLIQSVKQMDAAQSEVIRCKECKKWNVYGNRGEGWCDEWKEMLMDICFCSSAKRREVDDERPD